MAISWLPTGSIPRNVVMGYGYTVSYTPQWCTWISPLIHGILGLDYIWIIYHGSDSWGPHIQVVTLWLCNNWDRWILTSATLTGPVGQGWHRHGRQAARERWLSGLVPCPQSCYGLKGCKWMVTYLLYIIIYIYTWCMYHEVCQKDSLWQGGRWLQF